MPHTFFGFLSFSRLVTVKCISLPSLVSMSHVFSVSHLSPFFHSNNNSYPYTRSSLCLLLTSFHSYSSPSLTLPVLSVKCSCYLRPHLSLGKLFTPIQPSSPLLACILPSPHSDTSLLRIIIYPSSLASSVHLPCLHRSHCTAQITCQSR